MRKRSVIIAVFIIAICLLTACGAKSPSEKVVKDIIQSNNLNVLSNAHTNYYGDPIVFNIENINIELQQDNDKQSTVKCKLSLDNADYSATVYYTLDLVYYDKGGWVLNKVYEYNDYELLPKQGYVGTEDSQNSPLAQLSSYMRDYGISYNDAIASEYYLDLAEPAEVYYITYNGSTEFCDYSGSAYVYYAFNNRSGRWYPSNFESLGYQVTNWYLDKSMKCFHEYVRISNVDLVNYSATVECYHTDHNYLNSGVASAQQVYITPDDARQYLYFSPITIYYEGNPDSMWYDESETEYLYIFARKDGFRYGKSSNFYDSPNKVWQFLNGYYHGDNATIVDSF